MQSVTVNIRDESLTKKVVWMLKHFENDGLEITSIEDLHDLKAIYTTRGEETVSLEDYLQDEG